MCVCGRGGGQNHKTVPIITTFEEKAERRPGLEPRSASLLASLTPYRWAQPDATSHTTLYGRRLRRHLRDSVCLRFLSPSISILTHASKNMHRPLVRPTNVFAECACYWRKETNTHHKHQRWGTVGTSRCAAKGRKRAEASHLDWRGDVLTRLRVRQPFEYSSVKTRMFYKFQVSVQIRISVAATHTSSFSTVQN